MAAEVPPSPSQSTMQHKEKCFINMFNMSARIYILLAGWVAGCNNAKSMSDLHLPVTKQWQRSWKTQGYYCFWMQSHTLSVSGSKRPTFVFVLHFSIRSFIMKGFDNSDIDSFIFLHWLCISRSKYIFLSFQEKGVHVFRSFKVAGHPHDLALKQVMRSPLTSSCLLLVAVRNLEAYVLSFPLADCRLFEMI